MPDETVPGVPPSTKPPSTDGMTTKVVKGSLWTLAGQILPLGVSLIATPFTIRLLGAEGYGVFILIGLIPTYLGFADFGMSMASTKFGSEAFAEGDEEKEGRIIRTAALIALCTSVPVAALLMIFAGTIIGLFNVPPELSADAVLALRIASITFVINFLCGIFNTPQLARLRMDLNTFVTSGFRILGIVATPIVIYLGFGIIGAVVVLFAASLLTLLGHIYVSCFLLAKLWDITLDRTAIRPLVRFGGALAISGIAGIVLVNVEKGALSALTSPKALAYYYIAFTLVNMMTMFSSAMVQSLLPAFSQMQTYEDQNHLNSLFSRGVRINLIWLVPALVFLSLIAKPFFTVWAGEDFGHESVTPFYIMLAGIIVNIIAYFPNTAIIAAGRTEVLAKLYWAEAIPYVALVWLLTQRFGIVGAALAWSIRVIADAALMFVIAQRVVGVRLTIQHRCAFTIAALIMLVPFFMNLYTQNLTVSLVAISIGAGLCYAFLIWRHVLESEEIAWLSNQFFRFAR